MSTIAVQIDRMTLTDLEVMSAQAEGIRASIETELQHTLTERCWPTGLHGRHAFLLSAPALHFAARPSHGDLAVGVADSIAQALCSMGSLVGGRARA